MSVSKAQSQQKLLAKSDKKLGAAAAHDDGDDSDDGGEGIDMGMDLCLVGTKITNVAALSKLDESEKLQQQQQQKKNGGAAAAAQQQVIYDNPDESNVKDDIDK